MIFVEALEYPGYAIVICSVPEVVPDVAVLDRVSPVVERLMTFGPLSVQVTASPLERLLVGSLQTDAELRQATRV